MLLACRLCEKAYLQGYQVYLQTISAEQAQCLDDLLWTFRQGSFVPHTLYPPSDDDVFAPVLIGHGDIPAAESSAMAAFATRQDCSRQGAGSVLINLTPQVTRGFDRFDRVAELVDQDSENLRSSRNKFRFYRERGLEPISHRL